MILAPRDDRGMSEPDIPSREYLHRILIEASDILGVDMAIAQDVNWAQRKANFLNTLAWLKGRHNTLKAIGVAFEGVPSEKGQLAAAENPLEHDRQLLESVQWVLKHYMQLCQKGPDGPRVGDVKVLVDCLATVLGNRLVAEQAGTVSEVLEQTIVQMLTSPKVVIRCEELPNG